MHKIFIGIPSRSHSSYPVAGPLAETLLRLQKQEGCNVRIEFHGGQPVELARNNLARRFLETDCEYLLMIDDDIVPPDDILAMAEHGRDVIGGLCYAFNVRTGIFPVAFVVREDGPFRGGYDRIGYGNAAENQGVVEVGLLGSGCIMIHRRVFAALKEPYFKFEFDEAITTIEESEDFGFCNRAIEAGFNLYVDTDKVCGHLKTFDLRDMLLWMERMSEEKSLRKLRELSVALLEGE